ncbi:DUF3780 domain-containing protein [Chroococcidiopsis sp. FACHB-1243]|uniref:DUF3780 domain-containing protein n=1 Tax=Chroococcidiopsis sp. [FACHB-1243] TaxID=2692781 RepID=UPI00177F0D54|nr:DUF3780 domain-containing protein [Chroococcidiopsis sp. [FACHB-1243]]MBD2309384.1 DUF3780 domain-containing protein [Chroococcidiopsis sp. [FACHB-1243]]
MISKTQSSILGFGFSSDRTEHCFLVTFPASQAKSAEIMISEHFHWKLEQEASVDISFNNEDQLLKARLKRMVWEQIEEEVKAEFNRRLRAMDIKTGRWIKKGQVPVDRTLGKELILLAWAIEDADPTLIPTAIRNWLGLAPEERWWLYTMTNAATGHAIKDRNRGWRKAVRFALTENPVMESVLRNRYSDFELTLAR